MKKITALLFAVCFLFLFVSCGKNTDVTKESTTAVTKADEAKEISTDNSISVIEKSEAESIAGKEISVPKKSDGVEYFSVGTDEGCYVQTTFSVNELNYVYRIKKTDKFEDFSGLYFSWTDVKQVKVGDNNAEFRSYDSGDDSCSILLWLDSSKGEMITLSVDAFVEADELISVASNL